MNMTNTTNDDKDIMTSGDRTGESGINFIHTQKTFRTKNRALEQYLFSHWLRSTRQFRDENGFFVWEYETTPLLIETIKDFLNLQVYKMGWSAKN